MIRVFRLQNFVEIVGEALTYEPVADMITIKDPMAFQAGNHPQTGQIMMSFQPLLQFAKAGVDTIDLDSTHITYSYEPEDKLLKVYQDTLAQYRAKKSGVVQAPQQKIIF